MASTNESLLDRFRSTIARVERAAGRALRPLQPAAEYVFSSVFRFMIFLGIVAILLGATLFSGAVAGHIGIYGVSSIVIGLVGRLIIYIKSPNKG